jgi:GT2 family glycosyltransferase/glycosyltransferase involved in cell wall biosynthesis
MQTFNVPLKPIEDKYTSWLTVNKWNYRKEVALREHLKLCKNKELLSIIMPVYNVRVEYFDATLQSIRNQIYTNWELCICDDNSTDSELLQYLEALKELPNIKITKHTENKGISEATNSAAALASSRFLVFVDNDDIITPDALGEVIIAINENPDVDIIYSDDDKINTAGVRYDPQFKPDWNPELLLAYMYIGHILIVKKELFDSIGGLRKEFDGSQDYDLMLRATEKTSNIYHIPKILYHWKAVQGSTADAGQSKPESFMAGQKAIQQALQRRGIVGKVVRPKWAVEWNCGYYEIAFPHTGPEVTIIIPTYNQGELLSRCIQSIVEHTVYQNYKILVVNNNSDEEKTVEFLKQLPYEVLDVACTNNEFNFSEINNKAVEHVTTPYILFLNNDTQLGNTEWLSQLVGYMQMKGVGAVGSRLLYPNGLIQHAGIVHGYYDGSAAPGLKMMKSNHGTYMAFERLSRACTAVTAACMLTTKELFKKVNGFDQENFKVGYNDPDLCLRYEKEGYRSVYCATSILIHHENISRGKAAKDDLLDLSRYKRMYKNYKDKYYNPNLSLKDTTYSFDSSVIAPKILPKIKAFICSYNLNWEGSSFSNFELVCSLKKRNVIEPIVYCFQDGPLRKEYEKLGIQVIIKPSPLSKGFEIKSYLEGLEDLKKLILSVNPHVVYANTLQMFYGIDAAKQLNIPSIWNVRESEPVSTYFSHFGSQIEERAISCFYYPYKVVFVAYATKKGCKQLEGSNNFEVIHNAINPERFSKDILSKQEARKRLQINDDKIVFISVGTVCERKNQLDIPLAISKMPSVYADKLKIYIVGDRKSKYSAIIHEIIKDLPENKRHIIDMVPEKDDVDTYYAAADCFILTSKLESYPRVILEALHYNLPIISTPVMGVVEQIFDGITGKFYRQEHPERLMKEIVNMINLPNLRTFLSKNIEELNKGMFTHEDMIDRYEKLFKEAYISGGSR